MTINSDICGVLDRLCPMYLVLDLDGSIVRTGATVQKLRPDIRMGGADFLDVFEVLRPRKVRGISDLIALGNAKLRLGFRDSPGPNLKGVLVPIPQGFVINLSFGISVLDAVRDYALTSADFAATDMTIELLYLVEANAAAMEASRSLNKRLRGAMIAAEERAFTDTLTGLKNRRALDHVLTRLAGVGADYAVLSLDLDYFKLVNDTLGHAAGDHVLQHAARIMVEETRETDTVSRAGGDEFILVFDNVRDQSRLERIAQRLINRIEQPIPFDGQICNVSASIGIATSGGGSNSDPTNLIQRADMALYAAKNASRATWRVFDSAMIVNGVPKQRPTGDDAAERQSGL